MTEENNFYIENINNSAPEDFSLGTEPAIIEENKEQSFIEQQPNITEQPLNNNYVPNFYPRFDPVLIEEKRAVKRVSNIISASFLIMTGVLTLLNVLVIVFFAIAQKSLNEAAKILSEPAILQVQQIVLSMFAFTVPFIVVFKLSGIRISDLINFSVPNKRNVLPFFLIGVSFCSFANITSSIAASIFEKTNVDYDVEMHENPQGIFGFILAFTATVIMPALVEEFACRGLLLGVLRKFGDAFAVVVSSLLFGLMHGNFEQIPFAFLVGLVLGFITVKSGSIWIAIFVHAFNNFVSLSFDYFFSAVPNNIQNAFYTIFLMICLLVGIVAIFLIKNDKEDLYKFKPSNMKTEEKKKFIYFFTTPPMIIFIVFCFIESLQFFKF